MIKQIEPNRVSLCGVDFAIYPFGAMKAANLSGELGKFLGPIVAGCLPLIGSNDDDVLSMDLKDAMPLITGAFSTLDGDTIEKLFRKLLLQQNISCSYTDPATGQPVQTWLTQDVLDQIFLYSRLLLSLLLLIQNLRKLRFFFSVHPEVPVVLPHLQFQIQGYASRDKNPDV